MSASREVIRYTPVDLALYYELERPIQKDLQRLGVEAPDLYKVRLNAFPVQVQKDAVATVIDWLERSEYVPIREALYGVLFYPTISLDHASRLTRLFDQETDQQNRMRIGFLLARVPSPDPQVAEWLRERALDREHLGNAARAGLPAAVKLHLPREEACAVLVRMFRDIPIECASELRKIAGPTELAFLHTAVGDLKDSEARGKVKRAIESIERRLAKAKK